MEYNTAFDAQKGSTGAPGRLGHAGARPIGTITDRRPSEDPPVPGETRGAATTEQELHVRFDDAQAELETYKVALNQTAIVAVTDRTGTIVSVNDPFCRISQYPRAELIGAKHSILNSHHHPREFFRQMWRTIGSGRPWHGDICNRAKDGSLYWVDTTIVPRRDADGRISGYVSIRYDITRRKLAEAAQAEEIRRREKAELLLRDIIEALPDGVAAYDADDRLVTFNSAYRQSYDLISDAIVEGASFEGILRHGIERGQFALPKAAASREAWFEARMHDHRNPGRRLIQQLNGGRWLQVRERLSPSGYIVGVRTDITELKLAERQIKRQAERDPLTGLHNRRVVLDRLGRLLADERRRQEGLSALVLVDLDGFKTVNDTLGHDAGDALLVEVAERFRRSLRRGDTVARLGGDEFALILTDLSSEQDAGRVVEKLLLRLLAPISIGGRSVTTSGSFGVALIPRHGSTAIDLLKHADMALYQAKASGRSTWAVYDPDLRRTIERRGAMTEALRGAMARDQVKVALQPQISFVNGRHCGFEALVRWKRGRNMVPPPELISVAEDAGLIVPLGYYIIDKAMVAMRQLLDAGMEPGRLALNVAAAQLKDPGFAATLAGLIARHRLHATAIEIEITENVVLDRSSATIAATLQDLHAAGIAIALDDFGTGYASLAHLKRFPLRRLKIDRSFIGGVTANANDAAIARAIVSLAHSLGMEVVAEGVETEQQYQFLSNLGCDIAQGYLISAPLQDADVTRYMEKQSEFTMI